MMIHRSLASARGLLLLCAGSVVLPGLAAADDASVDSLQEVVVTAQKRTESLQSVPMSISVLSEQTIQDAGIADFEDYALKIPNLTFGFADGQGIVHSRSIAIRGVQGVATTGFYLNDLPLPDGVDPLAVDVQRIEVLRGPQGTLYGARSMGGTVRVITQTPDTSGFSASVHGLLSRTQDSSDTGYQIDSGVNVGLGDSAAVRLDAVARSTPGWFTRRYPDPNTPGTFGEADNLGRSDDVGANLALVWNVTDQLAIKPSVIYQRSRTNGMPLGDNVPSNNIQNRLFNVGEAIDDEWTDTNLVVAWQSPVGEVTSVSSYFDRNASEREDASEWLAGVLAYSPPLATPVVSRYPYHSFVQEIRLASKDFGPFRFTGGLYYSAITDNYRNPPWILNGLGALNDGAYGTDLVYRTIQNFNVYDKAAYGELTYTITSQWSVVAGVRDSKNEQRYTRNADGVLNGGPTFNVGSASQTKVTPKLTVSFHPNDNLNYYATAAEGFRPGGPNFALPSLCAGDLAALGLTLAQTEAYKSDHVWSYEVGEKAKLFGGRVSVDSAAYWINWTEIQQSRFLPTCSFSFIGNAGAARNRGAEIELSAVPMQGLSVSLGAGYTDAKITESGTTIAAQVGDPIQQVAPWTVNSSGQYVFPLAGDLNGAVRLDYAFVDNSRSATNDQFSPRLRPAYEIANARIGVQKRSWEGWFYVDNLSNTRPNLADDISTAGELPGRPRIVTLPPRTFGIEFRQRF